MKGIRIIVLLSLFGGMLSSCKKKTDPPVDLGYDYFPLATGRYIVYEADSTVYDDFNQDTTYYRFRIKEKLEEQFIDGAGHTAYRLVRYIKYYDPNIAYDDMPWTLKDVWQAAKTASTLEVVEENERLIKLSFPVADGASWKGNSLTTQDAWTFKYNYTDVAQTINGQHFDKVLYVEQKDDKGKNLIHRQLYYEKYARGIGMVYKEVKDLYSQNVNGLPVELRIEKGVIYTLTLISYGQE